MKLVQKEPESDALRRYLRRHRSDERVTSALSRVEVPRAVRPGGAAAVAQARRQLGRLHQVSLHATLLDAAASLVSDTLVRTLDAIHLASAQLLGADLRAVVTYDDRMVTAAADLGLPADAPGA